MIEKTKKSPHIICTLKFHKYYNSAPNRSKFNSDIKFNKEVEYYNQSNFTRCKSSDNLVSYLLRKMAADKQTDNETKVIKAVNEFTTASEKNLVDYADKRPGSTGAFDLTGDISEESILKIKDELRTTKSNIWSGVLSFTELYGAKNCNSKLMAKKLISENFNELIKAQNLDPDNVKLFAAFHNNTDHPHIHFFYWEKEAQRLDSKGLPKFSKGKFPIKAVDIFKTKVLMKCEAPLDNFNFNLRDQIRASFQKSNLENTIFSKFMNLNLALGTHSNQYKRLNSEQKKIIDLFVHDFIQSNKKLSSMWSLYSDNLSKVQKDIIKMHKENKIPLSLASKNFTKNRLDDLQGRCSNELLKTLVFLDNSMKLLENQKNKNIINRSQIYIKNNSSLMIKQGKKFRSALISVFSRLISDMTNETGNSINLSLAEFEKKKEREGDVTIYAEQDN